MGFLLTKKGITCPSSLKMGFFLTKNGIPCPSSPKKGISYPYSNMGVLLSKKDTPISRFLQTRYQESLPQPPRIITMLLRPVLRMMRDINVSVIAYMDDLLIFGSTKEECLSDLKKTMGLLVKLG
ncbi:hypothetical protein ACTFIW_008785 [Dictyostelium discoideum]